MALTSPDNIFSPDRSKAYALTNDLSQLTGTVQSALTRRANQYIGTSAEREASSNMPNGVHWQDTDGKQFKYTWLGGEWKPNRITQVMPFLEPFSAYNPETQGAGVVFEFSEGVVSFSGAASVGDSANISNSNPICNLPEWGRPTFTQAMGVQQGSGDSIWSLNVLHTDFTLAGVRYRPYSSSSRIWLPFSGTYTLFDF